MPGPSLVSSAASNSHGKSAPVVNLPHCLTPFSLYTEGLTVLSLDYLQHQLLSPLSLHHHLYPNGRLLLQPASIAKFCCSCPLLATGMPEGPTHSSLKIAIRVNISPSCCNSAIFCVFDSLLDRWTALDVCSFLAKVLSLSNILHKFPHDGPIIRQLIPI